MRACFALLERASARDVTVLLEGETGTGKSQAAQAIHNASARRDKPFIVVDCGAIPSNLLESELFGHEKGAFTGALVRRAGAFEEAHGGTVFLDEIGELPAELQPKLLRVLETREIRRVGSNTYQPVDIRLIAATHRDLRAEVNAGRFRSDLFFRLAVLRIVQPSLRQRPEDLPLLVEQILASLGADPERTGALRTPEFIARLQHAAWPGNVRELRNYLERCLVFEDALAISEEEARPGGSLEVDPTQPYADQRRRVVDDFERRYLRALLEKHQGKVAQAAVTAGVDRVHLYRLLRRHGIKP
jgi:DNA-binding NtrC family response regulator